MRKFTIILLFVLFFTPVTTAQELGYKVYLPVIISLFNSDNNWRLIKPQGSTNYVLNPSAESSTNFAALAGTTVTRVTVYQKYGLYSYRAETNADNEGMTLTLLALTNANHYITMRVRGTLPAAWDWSLDNTVYTAPRLIEKIDADWNLYGLHIQAAQASGSTTLYIRQNGAGSGDFYLDGIQVEPLDVWTTYIDGTQEGCTWIGAPHAAISERSSESRAGGISQDFFTEYNFQIKKVIGTSAITRQVGIDNYAILPGGELNNIKIQPREFTIIGKFIANTEQELHQKRQALQIALVETSYPNSQPFRVRFNGAQVQKELAGHYTGGLEGDLSAFYGDIEIVEDDRYMERVLYTENASIQIVSPFPFWQEVGESAAILDTNDSATFRAVAGRLRSTSQWSALGPPNAAGTYISILSIVEDDTYVYYAGNFLNFDNIAAADRIVRYNKQTGAYSAIDAGLNGIVHAMTLAPNGDLYVVGDFTNASGVAAADHIARLPAGGASFVAVGTPVGGTTAITTVRAVIYAPDGNLYIGGDFDNWADIADADDVVLWNGTSYARVGVGPGGPVFALLYHNGVLYAGGTFTGAVASFVPNTWTTLGNGLNNAVQSLAAGPGGLVYIGGTFTQELVTTISYPYIVSWNGSGFISMNGGADAQVYRVATGPDNTLYLSGDFTEVGGIAVSSSFARWNGHSFAHPDIELPASTSVFHILPSDYVDPVIKQRYSIYIGHDAAGAGTFAGKTTVDNEGSSPAFPRIVFSRSGGTTATIQTLKNERTGKEIFFNYSLDNGETLTINLNPTQRSAISSFFGRHLDAVLVNSNFGTWSLLPNDNDITSFVATTGSPTITAYLLWRETFEGYD